MNLRELTDAQAELYAAQPAPQSLRRYAIAVDRRRRTLVALFDLGYSVDQLARAMGIGEFRTRQLLLQEGRRP